MRKILGNNFLISRIFFFLFSFFLSLLYSGQALMGASIMLRIIDINNRTQLKAVAVGQPFIVEMRLQDFDEAKKAPVVPGLESLHVQQRQEQLSMVNGTITNQYQYVCRVDSAGSYNLGPVTIDHNGTPVTSNAVNFIAQEQTEPALTKSSARAGSSSKQRQKKEQPVICRLTFGREHEVDHVVVGQKITCTLRLYYSHMVTAVAGVRRPDLPGFVLGDFERKDEGQELIDGVEYRYIDFVGDICAQEPGKKMIPAFSVDYDVQLPSRGSFFDFFNHAKRERVYSNTAHLIVEALPIADKKVHGIGEFKAITVSLDAAQAKEGEGITLTIEVVGHGNFDIAGMGLAPFELQGLSDSLKQYASKRYTVPAQSPDQAEKTCFEFVVQGVRAGKQEIPAQEFTYFDVIKKKYITRRSKPVFFTVTPGAHESEHVGDTARSSSQDLDLGVDKAEESGAAGSDNSQNARPGVSNQMPLSVAAWYPVRQRGPMAWWLFMLFLLVPIMGLLSLIMHHRLERYQDRYARFTQAKRAFEQARSELAQTKKNHDIKSLYALFARLIARRCKMPETAISRELIKSLLEQRHYPSQEIEDWDLFMVELEGRKYGQDAPASESNAVFFEQAAGWISWLEKRL